MEEEKGEFSMVKFTQYIIALLFIIYSCKAQVVMEKKYQWLPTYSAPKVAPIEIYKGTLLNKDQPLIKIKNWGIINPGWGNSSGTAVIGSEEKLIPDSLDITWLSLSENVFYTINTALPKEKMEHLFEKGFISIYNNKLRTYDELIVGFAPKGFVSIWLSGEKEQVEIATFKGVPITIPLEKVASTDLYMFTDDYAKKNIADLPQEIQDQIKTTNLEINQWETFHKKNNWRTQFITPNNTIVSDAIISYCNGEKEAYIQSELKDIATMPRSLPQKYMIRWKNKELENFGADVALNVKEINIAFDSILNSGQHNIVMGVSIIDDKIFLNLQNDSFKYPIIKSIIDIYSIAKK
jgi:Protein of unknown function (DUF2931)